MSALTILSIESNGKLEIAILKFFNRILYYGDVIIYYYNPKVYYKLNELNVIDYILHMINPILGFFRMVAYDEPMGYKMVLMTLESNELNRMISIVGPNFQYYVEGSVYFGYIGGLLYSFIIGSIVGKIRNYALKEEKESLIKIVFKIWLFINIFTLPMETTYFITKVFDLGWMYLLIFIPCYIFVKGAKKKHEIDGSNSKL